MLLDFCNKCRWPYAKLRRWSFHSIRICSCVFILGKIRWVVSWLKNEETLESAALVVVFIDDAFYACVESAQLGENECFERSSAS